MKLLSHISFFKLAILLATVEFLLLTMFAVLYQLQLINQSSGIFIFILIGLFLICLTFVLLLLVRDTIVRNLRSLKDGANEISQGNLSYRFDETPMRELAGVNGVLNEMVIQLEQATLEHSLCQSQLDALLQSMNTGVVLLDRTKKIVLCNFSFLQLFEVPVSVKPQGRLLEDFVRHVELSECIETNESDVSPHHFDFVLFGNDKADKKLLITTRPLLAKNDVYLGHLLLFEDVTNVSKLEVMRSNFAANVSHELRTPITSIKGYVETLQECVSKDAAASDALAIIERNALRLENIIEDLLKLSQIEHAEDSPTFVSSEVQHIVDAVLQDVEVERSEVQARIVTEVQDSLRINCSERLVIQALLNLVQNAMRYGKPQGKVSIVAKQKGDRILLSVKDEGLGIPQHLHDRVFERFFRVDSGRSRNSGGTGLGLAIVKHVAQLHHGSVSVESSAECGSTFTMAFPVSHEG